MAITTFAAIDVGSTELSMKIFEISKKHGINELDHVRHSIELGSDTYKHGQIHYTRVDELCNVLNTFNRKIAEYNVSDYTACATSAIREARNNLFILDQIKLRTGLKVKILSNSEQRFLYYKAIALKTKSFNSIVKDGTAIVDVGAGSIQISLFNNEALVCTQNIKLGSLRLKELLSDLEDDTTSFNSLIEEYIDRDFTNFKRHFMNNIKIKNLIIIDNYFVNIINNYFSKKQDTLNKEQFMELYTKLINCSTYDISKKYQLPNESAYLTIPTALIYKKCLDEMDIKTIWFPGVTLTDALVAEYAEKREKIIPEHNFTNDIITSATNIATRYVSDTTHTQNVAHIALNIFDNLRKEHGLGKRERLLLQIAIILHNIGEFISINNVPESSYHIIMSTEIIGLSHFERVLVANLVRYNTSLFPSYDNMTDKLDQDNYIKISKLTSIMRIANAMDKSHHQKINSINLKRKDNQLIIIADTHKDITLEYGLFQKKADFFEKVYGIKPILKQKRSV